jgi:hypothetical protein
MLALLVQAYMFTVLRYLYSQWQILHPDISGGNVLYIEELTSSPVVNPESVGGEKNGDQKLPCFIKYVLGERYACASVNQTVAKENGM